MPFDPIHPRYEQIEHLERVIRLIETPDRWCKHHMHLEDGRHCIVGAMHWVDANTREVETAVLEAIWDYKNLTYTTHRGRRRRLNCERFVRVDLFNDWRTVEHTDAIAVLRDAQNRLINPPPPPLLYARVRRACIQKIWRRRIALRELKLQSLGA